MLSKILQYNKKIIDTDNISDLLDIMAKASVKDNSPNILIPVDKLELTLQDIKLLPQLKVLKYCKVNDREFFVIKNNEEVLQDTVSLEKYLKNTKGIINNSNNHFDKDILEEDYDIKIIFDNIPDNIKLNYREIYKNVSNDVEVAIKKLSHLYKFTKKDCINICLSLTNDFSSNASYYSEIDFIKIKVSPNGKAIAEAAYIAELRHYITKKYDNNYFISNDEQRGLATSLLEILDDLRKIFSSNVKYSKPESFNFYSLLQWKIPFEIHGHDIIKNLIANIKYYVKHEKNINNQKLLENIDSALFNHFISIKYQEINNYIDVLDIKDSFKSLSELFYSIISNPKKDMMFIKLLDLENSETFSNQGKSVVITTFDKEENKIMDFIEMISKEIKGVITEREVKFILNKLKIIQLYSQYYYYFYYLSIKSKQQHNRFMASVWSNTDHEDKYYHNPITGKTVKGLAYLRKRMKEYINYSETKLEKIHNNLSNLLLNSHYAYIAPNGKKYPNLLSYILDFDVIKEIIDKTIENSR